MTDDERRLTDAVALLEVCKEFAALVPEVRVNVVYAPAGAREASEVLGVDGRITVVAGMPKAAGPVRPGASDHMARLVVEIGRIDASVRAGLNFRWSETIGQADTTRVLKRDEDYDCGDTIQFHFIKNGDAFGVIVSINGRVVD